LCIIVVVGKREERRRAEKMGHRVEAKVEGG
jgi:hypothetical protein